MQTIVELPEFLNRAKKLLDDSERKSIASFLAGHPESGNILQGTGGIRKLRWSAQGKGKSGGFRVIYFFCNGTMPLFLLTVFAKGEKANISRSERNELAKLTSRLVENYGKPDE